MTFWRNMMDLDGRLRRFVGLFVVTPLLGLSIPVGVYILMRSSADHRGLEQRQMRTLAVIQKIAETGGRRSRNAVTSTFQAADGQTYVSKALYGIEGSKHLRPGMKLGVIYERDRPSNNAPTLAYAEGRVRDAQIFLAIMSALFALFAWIYRKDYAAMLPRMRA